MSRLNLHMIEMLTTMAMLAPERRERTFLMARGWLPLGREAGTGLEGWGKLIDGRAVTINEPEALALEGWVSIGGAA